MDCLMQNFACIVLAAHEFIVMSIMVVYICCYKFVICLTATAYYTILIALMYFV